MKRILFTLLIVLTAQLSFAGGGWPQPKQKGYFKLGQSFIYSSQLFGPQGDLVDITTIGLYSTSLYGEYGFTNRLTGILYFPFFVKNTLNEVQFRQSGNVVPGDEFSSIGDTDIGIKYGLITGKPVVVSASLVLGLPLGSTSGGDSQILQTGDGEFNQIIRIDASHSFYPRPFYATAYVGFNNRTNGFSDEARFGFEVGATFKKFIPILKLDVLQSFMNGTTPSSQNGIFSNNMEFVSPVIELNYQAAERWGVSISGAFALAGQNVLASPNLGFGLYFNL
ncbi:MAG: hypothetical protein RIB47_09145 [Cyclobacteriaceae bacterium]